MAVIPPQNPQDRIPNGPFNSVLDFGLYSNTGGRVIFGDNFVVDPATGRISVAPLAPFNGTVYRVSAGTGLDTTPASGIVATGSIGLQPLVTLTPGAYTYPIVSIDPYGHIYSIFNGTTPVQTITGTPPITVSGTSVSKSIGITGASTTAEGAVALSDDLTDTSTNRALSAQGAYVLQQETSYLGSAAANQIFGGTINGATGLVDTVSYAGATYPGIVAGSPLPAASAALEGLYFYISTPGNYTPPGGSAASVVKNDKIECIGAAWQTILCGYRPAAATTTTYGETILATIPETQALADNTKSVTPFSLSGMIATTTQYGFVTLATNADTAPFLNGTKVITPANLGFVSSSTVQRGVVLLEDTYSSPSVVSAPTSNALRAYYDGAFLNAVITAKGDLIVGNGPADPVVLPLGSQSSQLVVDLTKPQGIDWLIPDSQSSYPVGAIIWYLNGDVTLTPEPWLPCDGRSLDASITSPYYALYDIIGTTYNLPGDAPGTFRLPDLRGDFIRGWSGATQPPYPDQTPAGPTALDPGRGFATAQTSAYKQHNHGITDPGHVMPFSLTQHDHGTNNASHTHPNNGGNHYHFIGDFGNSEVVGNTGAFYDGNNGVSGVPFVSSAFTGVQINSCKTSLTVNNNVTALTVNTITTGVTVNNSPPTAPFPNETRPMNVALVPIIKYSFVPSGIPPGPPPFDNPTYTLTTTPSPALSGQTLSTDVLVTGVPVGTPLYWEMSGPGVTSAFFVSNSLVGTFSTDIDGLSTFTNQLVTVLPGPGPYTITTRLYTDPARTLLVGNATTTSVSQGALTPTYSVSSVPLAVSDGETFTTTLNTTNVSNGTTVYWSLAGVSITAAFFNPATLTGTATVNGSGVASVTTTLAAVIPPSATPYTAFIRFYSDAARTIQIGTAQGLTISSAVTATPLELGVYIDLYQYRNTGGVFPDGSYVGLNPNMRAANINTILPSLDKFYVLAETQIYSDGKLYFGNNVGNSAALVLNAAGTDWADNTGTVSGGYVSPTNPDYTFSAYALKNSMYYLAQQTAWTTKNLMLSIGGYNLSQFMDQAGNSALLAQTAADQIAKLVQITGAVGVDLDYEPVSQSCIPANMALLCQKIQAAVKALNVTYEVHLTLIPPLSQADPDLKIATALACQAYVDQINVMTYDDPNNLNEPPYEPGSVAVYNQTGVGRSVQSVQWFIDAGVTRGKLGMGVAGYGRNSANGQAFTNSGTPYDQIVRIAGSSVAATYEFKLGRFNGVVPITNPNPTTQANFYYSPTTAIWGFDSIDTITNKVISSSNMGLRAVFMWQLSNDYSDPSSALPAGNPLANFALIKGAQVAIAAVP
jgi:GH18 family chitinase